MPQQSLARWACWMGVMRACVHAEALKEEAVTSAGCAATRSQQQQPGVSWLADFPCAQLPSAQAPARTSPAIARPLTFSHISSAFLYVSLLGSCAAGHTGGGRTSC